MTPAARAVLQSQVETLERLLWSYRDRIAAAERLGDLAVVRDLGGRAAVLEAELRRMLRELRGR